MGLQSGTTWSAGNDPSLMITNQHFGTSQIGQNLLTNSYPITSGNYTIRVQQLGVITYYTLEIIYIDGIGTTTTTTLAPGLSTTTTSTTTRFSIPGIPDDVLDLYLNQTTTTTSTTTQVPINTITVTVSCFYYVPEISITNSVTPFTFSVVSGWTSSFTYSGFSYSSGQKPDSQSTYVYTGLGINNNSQFSFPVLNLTSSQIYTFVCEGGTPILEPDSQDSVILALKFLGDYELDNFQQKAADVNLSGTITITDALLISRKFVGLVEKFRSGDYLIDSVTFSLDDLHGNQSIGYTYSLRFLVYGDLSIS